MTAWMKFPPAAPFHDRWPFTTPIFHHHLLLRYTFDFLLYICGIEQNYYKKQQRARYIPYFSPQLVLFSQFVQSGSIMIFLITVEMTSSIATPIIASSTFQEKKKSVLHIPLFCSSVVDEELITPRKSQRIYQLSHPSAAILR